jgi:hypothetical protein
VGPSMMVGLARCSGLTRLESPWGSVPGPTRRAGCRRGELCGGQPVRPDVCEEVLRTMRRRSWVWRGLPELGDVDADVNPRAEVAPPRASGHAPRLEPQSRRVDADRAHPRCGRSAEPHADLPLDPLVRALVGGASGPISALLVSAMPRGAARSSRSHSVLGITARLTPPRSSEGIGVVGASWPSGAGADADDRARRVIKLGRAARAAARATAGTWRRGAPCTTVPSRARGSRPAGSGSRRGARRRRPR